MGLGKPHTPGPSIARIRAYSLRPRIRLGDLSRRSPITEAAQAGCGHCSVPSAALLQSFAFGHGEEGWSRALSIVGIAEELGARRRLVVRDECERERVHADRGRGPTAATSGLCPGSNRVPIEGGWRPVVRSALARRPPSIAPSEVAAAAISTLRLPGPPAAGVAEQIGAAAALDFPARGLVADGRLRRSVEAVPRISTSRLFWAGLARVPRLG
jgi:hypothetical protein